MKFDRNISMPPELIKFNINGFSSKKIENTRVAISFSYYKLNKKYLLITKHGKISISKRQLECLQCLVDGFTNTETAKLLFLSPRTVESYLGIIRRKLNCKKSIQIVRVLFDIV